MSDGEALAKDLLAGGQQLLAVDRLIDHQVATEDHGVLAYRPDVQIVHPADGRDLQQRPLDLRHGKVRRHRQHQQRTAVPQQLPAAGQQQHRNNHAGDRVQHLSAAHSIAEWWRREGADRYVRARQLLILAGNGGSNGCRCCAWKTNLQFQLCNRFDLAVTVAHYPTGTSKWNPVEHRLFSEISKNWAGEPLDSHQEILNFLRTTKTQTDLAVTAYLDRAQYETGTAVDSQLIRELRITPHKTLPTLNYTLTPNSPWQK